MALDDLGAAFTGQSASGTDPAQAVGQWDAWLERPGNRQALLQMGLQAMQPIAMGQTVGGHIAQAVGAGGEALTRASILDEKSQLAESKLAQADEKLRIAQQNADSGAIRAGAAASRKTGRQIGGLTDAFKARAAREDAYRFEKQLDKDAADLVKQSSDVLADKESDVVKKYRGKSKIEVREMLRKERPKPKYGNVPSTDDDDEETTATPGLEPPTQEAPPYPGARQAADGNWYVEDPKTAGKFLRVIK
jgi:hypothetical protein